MNTRSKSIMAEAAQTAAPINTYQTLQAPGVEEKFKERNDQ